jgi:hypothetical protein
MKEWLPGETNRYFKISLILQPVKNFSKQTHSLWLDDLITYKSLATFEAHRSSLGMKVDQSLLF